MEVFCSTFFHINKHNIAFSPETKSFFAKFTFIMRHVFPLTSFPYKKFVELIAIPAQPLYD